MNEGQLKLYQKLIQQGNTPEQALQAINAINAMNGLPAVTSPTTDINMETWDRNTAVENAGTSVPVPNRNVDPNKYLHPEAYEFFQQQGENLENSGLKNPIDALSEDLAETPQGDKDRFFNNLLH